METAPDSKQKEESARRLLCLLERILFAVPLLHPPVICSSVSFPSVSILRCLTPSELRLCCPSFLSPKTKRSIAISANVSLKDVESLLLQFATMQVLLLLLLPLLLLLFSSAAMYSRACVYWVGLFVLLQGDRHWFMRRLELGRPLPGSFEDRHLLAETDRPYGEALCCLSFSIASSLSMAIL